MMSIGTYLVGSAILLLLAAYLCSPFRRVQVDVDNQIEQWVSDARNNLVREDVPVSGDESIEVEISISADNHDVADAKAINFCPQCGRRVEADHRFCPGCGTPLGKRVK